MHVEETKVSNGENLSRALHVLCDRETNSYGKFIAGIELHRRDMNDIIIHRKYSFMFLPLPGYVTRTRIFLLKTNK